MKSILYEPPLAMIIGGGGIRSDEYMEILEIIG